MIHLVYFFFLYVYDMNLLYVYIFIRLFLCITNASSDQRILCIFIL